jgi:hypothetical protein
MEFEEIMNVDSDYFSATSSKLNSDKYNSSLEMEEILSSTKLDEQRASQYVR